MSFLIKNIYPILPYQVQNIAISIFGYKWQKRRFGGVFEEHLKQFIKREEFTSKDWLAYQNAELRLLLHNSMLNVPYYQNKFKEILPSLNSCKKFSLEDLSKLPFLEKEDLRKFGTSTLQSNTKEKDGEYYASSGSTGTPTKILFSTQMHQKWSAAFESRIRIWAGLTKNDPRGMIGGRRILTDSKYIPPYYRYNYFEKQTYFSAYHISKQTASNYRDGIIKNNVAYMTGYAMSNYFLADFFKIQNLELPELKAVITSSEKLTTEMRDIFKQVYGCKTYDSYSGVEACGLISECEFGSLHISPDVGIIELINSEGRPCQPGETGEIVSTGFLNYDQPLIRYKIGDSAKLSKNQNCQCGREMPRIDEIIGRTEDVIESRDGRKMVRFHGLYVDIPNLKAGQIIQNNLDEILIKLVVDDKFDKSYTKLIENRVYSQLGRIKVSFEILGEIPLNNNGKFKAVISRLNK